MIINKKSKRRWLVSSILLSTLLIIGFITYYFVINKEPTQGTFVYRNDDVEEVFAHGNIYQSS